MSRLGPKVLHPLIIRLHIMVGVYLDAGIIQGLAQEHRLEGAKDWNSPCSPPNDENGAGVGVGDGDSDSRCSWRGLFLLLELAAESLGRWIRGRPGRWRGLYVQVLPERLQPMQGIEPVLSPVPFWGSWMQRTFFSWHLSQECRRGSSLCDTAPMATADADMKNRTCWMRREC